MCAQFQTENFLGTKASGRTEEGRLKPHPSSRGTGEMSSFCSFFVLKYPSPRADSVLVREHRQKKEYRRREIGFKTIARC